MNSSRNAGRPRPGFVRCAVAWLALAASASAGAGTAREELLALVPADAGLTLVIDGLRDRSREVLASPLLEKLRAVPAVKAWERSDKARGMEKARDEIERALGVSATTLRDDLLGDAVVLALHVPPGRSPDEASGLLLTKVRDRAALDRLIANVNATEKAAGTLARLVEAPPRDGGPAIWNRKFAAGTKPDEWYAILGGDVFAWSNSESLLREALARGAAGGGLGAAPRFREVDRGLPESALARLYLDPRFLERIAEAEARAGKPPAEPLVVEALAALEYAGAALVWRDGPVVHLHETFNAERSPAGWLGKGSARAGADPVLHRFPSTAVAVASWRWDLPGLYDQIIARLPEAERPRAEAAMTMTKGMLMGKDLRREILPFVGSTATAYLDAPKGGPLSAVCSIPLAGRPEVAQAIDNGLRTLAALIALDPGRKGGPVRVESADRDGLRVTTLAGADRPWSFACLPDRLVFGTGPGVVRRTIAAEGPRLDSAEEARIGRMRRDFFPDSEEFLAADLEALHRAASARRDVLAGRHAKGRGVTEAEARRDLDRALELLDPFGGAFASWSASIESHSAHQVLGVIGRGGTDGR